MGEDMLPAILLILTILWIVAVLQPGGTDFVRVSVFSLNGRTLTVLDALIAAALLGVMAWLRGAVAIAGVLLFVLWGMSVLGYVRVEGVPVAALAVLVMILGGVVQVMGHWARR